MSKRTDLWTRSPSFYDQRGPRLWPKIVFRDSWVTRIVLTTTQYILNNLPFIAQLFYWTHMLCLPFFLLMILHAGNVWKWLIGPLCLFGAEICYRIGFICCSERGRTQVTALQLLPNQVSKKQRRFSCELITFTWWLQQVVKLKIDRPPDFEFKAGDYVYVNIPHVAKFEWHPFTISSAPEDEGTNHKPIVHLYIPTRNYKWMTFWFHSKDYMTLHVRVAGGWTGRLYSMCQEDAERLERQHSRHRIAQRQLSNKLSPFQSMPMQLEKSVDMLGQDNAAYQQESTSLPPTVNTEIAISIVSTAEPPSRTPTKDISPLEVTSCNFLFDFWDFIKQSIRSIRCRSCWTAHTVAQLCELGNAVTLYSLLVE